MKIGYARVSTDGQVIGSQVDALKKYGCKMVYQDKQSGKDQSRPQLQKMLESLRSGDVVVITKLDRLGRSLHHLIELIEVFRKAKVGFVSLSDHFDTTTSQGKLLFNIMGAVAEFERDLISERTKAGLEYSKSKGVQLGKRPGLNKEAMRKCLAAQALFNKQGMSVTAICDQVEISRATFYRYKNEYWN